MLLLQDVMYPGHRPGGSISHADNRSGFSLPVTSNRPTVSGCSRDVRHRVVSQEVHKSISRSRIQIANKRLGRSIMWL